MLLDLGIQLHDPFEECDFVVRDCTCHWYGIDAGEDGILCSFEYSAG